MFTLSCTSAKTCVDSLQLLTRHICFCEVSTIRAEELTSTESLCLDAIVPTEP